MKRIFPFYFFSLCFLVFFNTRGADKSLARPASRCRRTESIVSVERCAVHVPNCKSFLVTEAEKKHVRWRARFQHSPPPHPCKATPKEIDAILTQTLGEHAPSYATVKTGWSSLNVVIFTPVMRLVLDDPNSDHPRDYWSNSRGNFGRPPDFS